MEKYRQVEIWIEELDNFQLLHSAQDYPASEGPADTHSALDTCVSRKLYPAI